VFTLVLSGAETSLGAALLLLLLIVPASAGALGLAAFSAGLLGL
jgi:hypothetical protein